MYANSVIIELVTEIKDNQKEVAELYKALQNPTDEFLKCYDLVESMYSNYLGLTNLAIYPKGSLTTYSDEFSKYDSAFMDDHHKLELLTPEK